MRFLSILRGKSWQRSWKNIENFRENAGKDGNMVLIHEIVWGLSQPFPRDTYIHPQFAQKWLVKQQGIGANSGPAGFVHSFKCIRTRNTAFPRLFADFICHVQHYVSHFASLSPMKYGLCILFLLRSTSTQRLRPTRCFFRHLFLFSCIPCQAFWFFFAASFASFSFI